MNRILLFLSFFIVLQSSIAQHKKINGVSFVANRNPVDSTHVKPLLDINSNYAAVMPFGFVPVNHKPQIVHNKRKQWYGETRAGVRNYVIELHKGGLEVMVKPQLWIRHGEYTGYLKMETEEEWVILENQYRSFIMNYATIAQEQKTAIFCIGTELEQFVLNRPDFWVTLIKDIRKIYDGKLTYAANWDEYKRVTFWGQLDYVGIDSYFPVSDMQTPTVEDAKKGWGKWKKEISAFAKMQNKQILFTEWGYRSMDYTGKEPWVSGRDITSVNLEAQANATQAVFETFWNEDWFAGGFVWKWFIFHETSGGVTNNRFTPQNKPAETTIKNYYEK